MMNRSGVYMPIEEEGQRGLSAKKPTPLTCPSPPPRPTHTSQNYSHMVHEPDKSFSFSADKSFIEEYFTVQSKLGQGSFGDVYRCRCVVSGREYAVKRAKRGWTSGGDRSRQLSIIHRIIKIPPSPYVIHLLRAWEEAGILYQQMELCSISLSQHIQSRVLTQSEVLAVFVDLLNALVHLGKLRLVHLDVKPENVFKGRGHFGIWKLGDFGICVEYTEGDPTSATQSSVDFTEGDSRYLAPEVMQGCVSPAADIFSLGLTIVEVACSVDLPKSGPLWHQLRGGGELPEPVPAATPLLLPLLQQMLSPAPTSRPTPTALLAAVQLRSARRRRRWNAIVSEWIRVVWSFIYWIVSAVRGAPAAAAPPLEQQLTATTPFPAGNPPFASTPIARTSARRRAPATPLSHSRNLLKEFDAVG